MKRNQEFNEFLTNLSARAEFTSTYSPESDVAESANRTILTLANTLRLAGDFPRESAELEQTAYFLHSLGPSRANPGCVSRYEMIHIRMLVSCESSGRHATSTNLNRIETC
jgi:hypothetical protein